MPKKKNPFINAKNVKSGIAMMTSSKTNPINDGVQNTNSQQNTGAMLNMPTGAKKPENTSK